MACSFPAGLYDTVSLNADREWPESPFKKKKKNHPKLLREWFRGNYLHPQRATVPAHSRICVTLLLGNKWISIFHFWVAQAPTKLNPKCIHANIWLRFLHRGILIAVSCLFAFLYWKLHRCFWKIGSKELFLGCYHCYNGDSEWGVTLKSVGHIIQPLFCSRSSSS